MMDMDNNSVTGGLSRDARQQWLPVIADEITENFCKSYAMRQTIKKYAIRTGAFHILTAGRDAENNLCQWIDGAGLSQEIKTLLAGLLSGETTDLAFSQAIRDQDIGRMKQILTEKCRSAFADGARNPRFRAIRTILHNAASENVLCYRPGRGLYSKAGEQWACFAFSDDEELPLITNPLEQENYKNWPLPPFAEKMQKQTTDTGSAEEKASGKTSEANELPGETTDFIGTQKDLVLESARFFWNETARRHGPGMVLLLELKRYMEKSFPPWIMTAFLPDPVSDLTTSDTPWDRENDEGDSDRIFGHNIPSTSGLWPAGGDDREPEDAIPREKTLALAGMWLNSLTGEDAAIFCMRYHCEHTLKGIADRLKLSSFQYVHNHYKSCLEELRNYCTRQEGLSPPDEDPALAALFVGMLREVCTKEILKGDCE